MAAAEQTLNVTVEVSAAIATLLIKGSVLLRFKPGECLEIDSGGDSEPTVTLFVNGKPFAIASVARRDGRLVANIVEIVSASDQEGYNPWLLKKRETATA